MELTRGTLTTIFATSSGSKGLVAIHFCIDLAETPPYPAIQYAIDSWCKSDELAKEARLLIPGVFRFQKLSSWIRL